MIEISRVEEGLARFGERFLNRFFTAGERADCGGQANRLAARLAGKEAVAKALGTGIGPVGWRDIEIRGNGGRPTLTLYGKAAEVSDALGITQWDISLTHTRTDAGAVVVAL